MPEVDLGVPLGIGSTSRLVSIVRVARAKEIILTCDQYSSEDLYAWGMISRVVAPGILIEAARDIAKRLIAKSSRAVAGAKLSVNAIAAVTAREVTAVQPELFIHSPEARGIGRAV